MATFNTKVRLTVGAVALALAASVLGGTAANAEKSVYGGHWFTVDKVEVSVQPLKRDSKTKITVTLKYRSDEKPEAYNTTPRVQLNSSGEKQSTDWELVELKYVSKGVLRGSVYVDNDVSTGKWWVTSATAFPLWDKMSNGNYRDSVYYYDEWVKSFYLKRTTKVTVNASPEPVKKGATITVQGKLTKLSTGETFDHTDAKYTNYKNRYVKYYFDPAGSAGAKYMGKSLTSSYGNYKKTFPAVQDGRWFVKVDSTTNYTAVKSDLDWVDVK